ncbi:MAG: hypothetical protein RBR16_06220 [Syntrophus sp. (in: bacteria)]|nr:hypothetical protein [Syntrophus sp. (in: bacteria)]
MRRVPSEKLEPGMILARPILMKNGMVLFGEGTELTDGYIERIRNMAVESIQVEGSAPLTESREKLMEELEARFRPVEQQPYMKLLKKLVEEQIAGHYQS